MGRIGQDLPSSVDQEVPAEPCTGVVAKPDEEAAGVVLDAVDTAVAGYADL